MAPGVFQTVLGTMRLGTRRFSPTLGNAGFCDAILRKNTPSNAPARLRSLVYILPVQGEETVSARQPLAVNLLVQLHSCSHQNNYFLQGNTIRRTQLTTQLKYALNGASGAARARAREIENGIRGGNFQNSEFRRAIGALERELKKKMT